MASPGIIRAGKGEVELGLNASPMQAGLNTARRRLQTFGASVQAAGMSMLRTGIVMGAALLPAVIQFANYEQSLADLRASSNPTAEQFEELKTKIEEISRATGVGPAAVTAAFSDLLKAGKSVDEVLNGLGRTTVQFARVSGMEMAESATILSDALNVFGRDGMTAAQASNILNQAADASTISLRDVTESFANVGATASLFDQNMRDMATTIALLGKDIIKGAEAGTALKTLLLRIGVGGGEASEGMAMLGLSVASFRDASGRMLPMIRIIQILERATAGLGRAERDRALALLAGDKAFKGIASLLRVGSAGFEQMQQEMDRALTVEEKFAVMTGTLWGQLQRVWAHLQIVGATIGGALAPALASVMEPAMAILNWVDTFVKKNQSLVQMFAFDAVKAVIFGAALLGLGVIIKGIALAIGGLVTGVIAVKAALAVVFSPIGLIILAIAGHIALVVTAVSMLYAYWDDLLELVVATWETLRDSAFGQFVFEVAKVAAGIAVIATLIVGVVTYVQYLAAEWVAIKWWEGLQILWEHLPDLIDMMMDLVDATNELIGELVELIIDGVTKYVEIWHEGLAQVAAWILAMLPDDYAAKITEITNAVYRHLQFVAEALQETVALWIEGVGELADFMRGRISAVLTFLASTGEQALSRMSQARDQTLHGFTDMFGRLQATGEQAWEGIKNAFAAGDFELIWAIVKVSAQLMWNDLSFFVTSTFYTWKDALTDVFTSVWINLRTKFIEVWGEIKAVAFEGLAAIVNGMASIAVGPAADTLRSQAGVFSAQAVQSRTGAAARVAEINEQANRQAITDWFTRAVRDVELEMGRDEEAARLEGELDALTRGAQNAADQAAIDRVNRAQFPDEADVNRQVRGSVMGTFSADAAFGMLGGETAMDRVARQQRDQIRQTEVMIDLMRRMLARPGLAF